MGTTVKTSGIYVGQLRETKSWIPHSETRTTWTGGNLHHSEGRRLLIEAKTGDIFSAAIAKKQFGIEGESGMDFILRRDEKDFKGRSDSTITRTIKLYLHPESNVIRA